MRDKFSVLQDGKFWRWTVVTRMYFTPLNCSLKMVKIVNFVLFILPQVTIIKKVTYGKKLHQNSFTKILRKCMM